MATILLETPVVFNIYLIKCSANLNSCWETW